MAGHSKWHNIKHRKGAQDAKRGKVFTKHAKLITIAAKAGTDVEMNPTLKTAIANAKADNVPNDNIKRALQKAEGGKGGIEYHEVAYEGYAPGGVAIIIESLTDNTNRAFAAIRTIVEKGGGNLGSAGAVSWMFQDKGHIELLTQGQDQEEIEMDIIEAGAEDLEFGEDRVFITTAFEDLGMVRDALQEKGYTLENIKKDKIPDNAIEISDAATAQKFLNVIDKLEEEDDVSDVYHNAEISDEIMDAL